MRNDIVEFTVVCISACLHR